MKPLIRSLFNHAALVVIDMQQAYFQTGELNREQQKLTDACNALIAASRDVHKPIIFIRTAHTRSGETWTLSMKDDAQGYLFDRTNDVDFVDGLDKNESDITITKLRDSAFHATIFEQVLREHHIDTLILTGVSTQTCVGQTAADAYARNLRVILVDDAIGTHDKTYHEPTLAMLAKEYRQSRMDTGNAIKWIQSASSQKENV